MMDRTERDLARAAALQMPQQAPPIDRASPIPTPAMSNTPGVEANKGSGPFETIGKGLDKLGSSVGLWK